MRLAELYQNEMELMFDVSEWENGELREFGADLIIWVKPVFHYDPVQRYEFLLEYQFEAATLFPKDDDGGHTREIELTHNEMLELVSRIEIMDELHELLPEVSKWDIRITGV